MDWHYAWPVPVPFLSGDRVEEAVSPLRAVEAVRDGFVAYARGEWSMPPKVYVPAYPAGDFRAMPALGAGHALLKWVTSFPGNPAHGLPTVTGLVLLSDASNGMPEAVLDAGAVTALRTRAGARDRARCRIVARRPAREPHGRGRTGQGGDRRRGTRSRARFLRRLGAS